MKLELSNNKDFWAGLMLIAVGAVAMLMSRNYEFGDSLRMGPGYFPRVLGGILVAFGLYVLGMGLYRCEKIVGSWSLRALVLLPLSLALFGYLIDRAGFVPAMMVLVFGSAMAGSEFKFLEVLLFSVFLTALGVVIFIWGLGLPYPLIADFQ